MDGRSQIKVHINERAHVHSGARNIKVKLEINLCCVTVVGNDLFHAVVLRNPRIDVRSPRHPRTSMAPPVVDLSSGEVITQPLDVVWHLRHPRSYV